VTRAAYQAALTTNQAQPSPADLHPPLAGMAVGPLVGPCQLLGSQRLVLSRPAPLAAASPLLFVRQSCVSPNFNCHRSPALPTLVHWPCSGCLVGRSGLPAASSRWRVNSPAHTQLSSKPHSGMPWATAHPAVLHSRGAGTSPAADAGPRCLLLPSVLGIASRQFKLTGVANHAMKQGHKYMRQQNMQKPVQRGHFAGMHSGWQPLRLPAILQPQLQPWRWASPGLHAGSEMRHLACKTAAAARRREGRRTAEHGRGWRWRHTGESPSVDRRRPHSRC